MSFLDKLMAHDTGERGVKRPRRLAVPYHEEQDALQFEYEALRYRYRFEVRLAVDLMVDNAVVQANNVGMESVKRRARDMIQREIYGLQIALAQRVLDMLSYGDADEAMEVVSQLLRTMETPK